MNAPADPPPADPPPRTLAARLLGDRAALGYLLILIATILFGANNNLAKESYRHGVSVDTVLVGRSWFLVPLLCLWFAARRSWPAIPRGMAGWLVLGAILFSLNGWALLSAFDRMSVSLSILVFYLFPFLVGLLAAALRIEPLHPAMLVGLVVAFIGLFLALDVEGELQPMGVALSVASALAISGNILVSGKLMRHGMSPVAVAFWMVLGSSIAYGGSLVASGGFHWPNSTTGWAAFSGTIVFICVAFVMFYSALNFLRESRTALVMNLEPVFTIVMAVFLFGEAFGATQWLGAALVVLAIVGVTLAGRKA
ncbi:MAG: DMT family transporter [Rhodospirillaceae bacterium]|nr:DMT family transporter [Rhodospirillaceae bacterium]MYH38037.1 DMT family transporter [Rhodospirillaceae bacterium]MYK15911.1 DMT family transporter [Rhodospirillaceae bacterium]